MLWSGSIEGDGDTLALVMFRRELQMRAATAEVLPGQRVRPPGCDRPPTADGGGFHLNAGDRRLDASGAPLHGSAPHEEDEADGEDEASNASDDEYS